MAADSLDPSTSVQSGVLEDTWAIGSSPRALFRPMWNSPAESLGICPPRTVQVMPFVASLSPRVGECGSVANRAGEVLGRGSRRQVFFFDRWYAFFGRQTLLSLSLWPFPLPSLIKAGLPLLFAISKV